MSTHTMEYCLQKDVKVSSMDYAIATWYIPKEVRQVWASQVGFGNQMELTRQIPNLNKVEIENSIAAPGACRTVDDIANGGVKVVGFNLKRGIHWDKFASLVQTVKSLMDADVIVLNEMDIGMARSGNLHTTRRLAFALGMNYAWGLEFVELTRGTREEQSSTQGHRDALSLHGNAILTGCHIYDPLIVRDDLPDSYFTDRAVKHVNSDGYEKRLGGRMGLLVRISFRQKEEPQIVASSNNPENTSPLHIVVGSVHKLSETASNLKATNKYFAKHSRELMGIVLQGVFERSLCSFVDLYNVDTANRYTFPSQCKPNLVFGHKRSETFCSDMGVVRQDDVTPPCWFSSQNDKAIRMSYHAIVSIILESTNVTTT